MLLCLKLEPEQLLKPVFLRNWAMDVVPKLKIVLVNFSLAVFSLLDFLTHEAGTNKLSQNFGVVLPLHTV
jgi:hypothetical protein